MSNNQFTALHATALSPACHLPTDPAEVANNLLPIGNVPAPAACVRILLNELSNRLSQDSATAADGLVISIAESAVEHILELLAPRQEPLPG